MGVNFRKKTSLFVDANIIYDKEHFCLILNFEKKCKKTQFLVKYFFKNTIYPMKFDISL